MKKAFLSVIGAVSLLSACFSNEPGTHPSGRIFVFEYRDVEQFVIAKNDPEVGDRWTAQLDRNQESGVWEITSAPGGKSLVDRRAKQNYVMHLLDSLRSVKKQEVAGEEPRSRMGLEPPRFALRWVVDGDTYEFKVGIAKPNSGLYFAEIPGQKPFLIRGSTVSLLKNLRNFSALRENKVTTVTSNDVVEFEVYGKTARQYYAARQNGRWADQNQTPIPVNVTLWLKKAIGVQAKRFVDDANRSKKLFNHLMDKASHRLIMTDRHGKAVAVMAGKVGNRLFGATTSRPNSVFELSYQDLKALTPPARPKTRVK